MSMDAVRQAQMAFFLTGRIDGGMAPCGPGMRPALLARFGDLARLRYDFPVVLAEGLPTQEGVQPLTEVFDAGLRKIAGSEHRDRIALHAYEIESEIRRLVAAEPGRRLSELVAEAGRRLDRRIDGIAASLGVVSEVVTVDGVVADCGPGLSFAVFSHLWTAVQARKGRRAAADIQRLILRLSEILQTEALHGEEGWTPDKLRASVGKGFADAFDFDRLSGFAGRAAAGPTLSPARRRRIESLLGVLRSQRFFASDAASSNGQAPYEFRFNDAACALAAFQVRLPHAVEVARAMAVAELEIEGLYVDAKHDRIFEHFGLHGLDESDLARFPDYLVCLNADRLGAPENAALVDVLAAGLPMKVVVETDDLMQQSPVGGGASALGLPVRDLAGAAMNLTSVFVLQTAAANLPQMRDAAARAMSHRGPVLAAIYTGGAGDVLPAYLMSAAAMEARAFPSFVYDPGAGPDWASRFSVSANPQIDRDWPAYPLQFEGAALEQVREQWPFTYVDFAACDPRFVKHFALVGAEDWMNQMQPPDKCAADSAGSMPERIPFVYLVDGDNRLHRAVADRKILRQAERARAMWVSLRELGGIENSHVRAALALNDKRWEARLLELEAPSPVPASPSRAPSETAQVQGDAAQRAVVSEPPAPAPSSDEPYIETARCTSCNECIQVNNKMFVYNDDKQALIADKMAGTYRQLVEAAEGCQVAIIHPGKPWNPNEPGLQELLERAAPFI